MDHREVAEKVENGESVEVSGHSLSPEMFDIRTYVPEGMDGEEFSAGTVYIDDEMDEELEEEAFVAEVIRAIQQKRKDAGLEVEDSVRISFDGDTEPVEKRSKSIEARMNVSELSFDGEDMAYSGKVEFRDYKVEFNISEPLA